MRNECVKHLRDARVSAAARQTGSKRLAKLRNVVSQAKHQAREFDDITLWPAIEHGLHEVLLGIRNRAGDASDARCRGDLLPYFPLATLVALSTLGDLDGAFALADKEERRDGSAIFSNPVAGLWWPTSGAMHADPRFLPLVEKLGPMDYWRTTKSQPDVCETEDVPFCRELTKAAQP